LTIAIRDRDDRLLALISERGSTCRSSFRSQLDVDGSPRDSWLDYFYPVHASIRCITMYVPIRHRRIRTSPGASDAPIHTDTLQGFLRRLSQSTCSQSSCALVKKSPRVCGTNKCDRANNDGPSKGHRSDDCRSTGHDTSFLKVYIRQKSIGAAGKIASSLDDFKKEGNLLCLLFRCSIYPLRLLLVLSCLPRLV